MKNIFVCKQNSKWPAYKDPPTPCYKIRETKETPSPGPCERCAININREVPKKVKILAKTQ